jgi:hypothetical protein
VAPGCATWLRIGRLSVPVRSCCIGCATTLSGGAVLRPPSCWVLRAERASLVRIGIVVSHVGRTLLFDQYPTTGEQLHHPTDNLLQHRLQRFVGWRWHFDEDRRAVDASRYTPSSTRQCRWMLRLAAEPKRWISVTAPLSASSASNQGSGA